MPGRYILKPGLKSQKIKKSGFSDDSKLHLNKTFWYNINIYIIKSRRHENTYVCMYVRGKQIIPHNGYVLRPFLFHLFYVLKNLM